ncbi:hypothetical protein ON010_g15953 [Phytophthora cinnamomi]|nr:hypothetical protein ON010_g15953 [Phytophthora cinnamomi]
MATSILVAFMHPGLTNPTLELKRVPPRLVLTPAPLNPSPSYLPIRGGAAAALRQRVAGWHRAPGRPSQVGSGSTFNSWEVSHRSQKSLIKNLRSNPASFANSPATAQASPSPSLNLSSTPQHHEGRAEAPPRRLQAARRLDPQRLDLAAGTGSAPVDGYTFVKRCA